ncbi:hypothetical protein APED_24760 [Acanthopleuribacter pedis]
MPFFRSAPVPQGKPFFSARFRNAVDKKSGPLRRTVFVISRRDRPDEVPLTFLLQPKVPSCALIVVTAKNVLRTHVHVKQIPLAGLLTRAQFGAIR